MKNNNNPNKKNIEKDNLRKKALTQFNNFTKTSNSILDNKYIMLYQKILSNDKFSNYLNYTKENRIDYLSKFPLQKKVFNFPIITNILICHINNIIGYSFNQENNLKMYLIKADLKGNLKKLFDNYILVSEKILMNKIGNLYDSSIAYRPLNIYELDIIKYL
jgi:hypothetical protein